MPDFELRSGIRLSHEPSDDAWSLFREIFIDECYTGHNFYSPQPEDTVVDVGANIGFFSSFILSKEPQARIHCFEPSSRNRRLLISNLERNNFLSRVTLHSLAVWDKPSKLELQLVGPAGDYSIISSNTTSAKSAATETVDVIPFADAVEKTGVKKIQLLKMDIEGAELEIVENSPDHIWNRIERIVMEYHEGIRPGSLLRIKNRLQKHYSKITVFKTSPDGKLGILRASHD